MLSYNTTPKDKKRKKKNAIVSFKQHVANYKNRPEHNNV